MLQLLRAAAATLLLLQIVSVEGLINTTGCEQTKACWTTEDCLKDDKQDEDRIRIVKEIFYFRDKKDDIDAIRPDCAKYFIVEPGTDDFVFEIRHSDIDKDKAVTLGFNGQDGAEQTFTCNKEGVKIGDKYAQKFSATKLMDQQAEPDKFYCRFKVTEKTKNTEKEFWATFTYDFKPDRVSLKYDSNTISIDDYNAEKFKGRVPCKNVFSTEKEAGNEYHTLPSLNVGSRHYKCPDKFRMSHKGFTDFTYKIPEKNFKYSNKNIKCELGKVTEEDDDKLMISAAKCARLRYTFCDDLCNSTECAEKKIEMKQDNEKRKFVACSTSQFMIVNDHIHTRTGAKCSEQSTPTEQLWDSEVEGLFKEVKIDSVKCVDELDCNEIAPFGEAKCENCSKVSAEGTCPSGSRLVWIDADGVHHYVTVTCDKDTGLWKMEWDGKSQAKGREDASKIELTCFGPKPKEPEKPAPAAASTNLAALLGGGLAVLLLLLVLILLLYWFCCRKKPVVKEESRKEKAPLAPPSQPAPEPSVVEDLPPAPVVAIASSESDQPAQYSGQRVQFINVSKEHLREIEPTVEDDRYKEYSARDMTDSERSKGSQMSQVGTGATFTGTRGTEQTNELSRTIAAADATRSDVSLRNSGSQVGEAPVATIGAAAEANKRKQRDGPHVAFRERVSYETETKTRDRSSIASMHTAPEQPAPVVEASKDDPSRLGADAARKAFGARQRTQSTQNTNATNDGSVVGNRSDSRVTDISRTG